jgi:hypothetical protein
MRVIAVDWSGAKAGVRGPLKLWHAEAANGGLCDLRGWRERDGLVAYLTDVAATEPGLVVGLDFAFSAPRWFLDELCLRSAPELWDLACSRGEGWLAGCEPPFWGRIRGSRPEMPSLYRRADMLNVAGISPKSVFQIGGPGQVGTGSVRGWPYLKRLRDAGFAVWPFDASRLPLAVEIYPRLLTGAVNKSRPESRATYLDRHYPELDAEHRAVAAASEDAFDAAVSALVMSRLGHEFSALPRITDPTSLLEGLIWKPDGYAH